MRAWVVLMVLLAGCIQVGEGPDDVQDDPGETRSPREIWEQDHVSQIEREPGEPVSWSGNATLPPQCQGERRPESPVASALNGTIGEVATEVAEALDIAPLRDGRPNPLGWTWNTTNGALWVSHTLLEDVRPNDTFGPSHGLGWSAKDPVPAEASLLALGRHFLPLASWTTTPDLGRWSLHQDGMAHVDPTFVWASASMDPGLMEGLQVFGIHDWQGGAPLSEDELERAGKQWADCWWEARALPGAPSSLISMARAIEGHAVVDVIWSWASGRGFDACHVQMNVVADPVNGSSEVVRTLVENCDGVSRS